MDIFAGSEPRLFISFRLENETTGQPAQNTEEKMDTSSPSLVRREAVEETSSDEIEVIEITLSSPECTDIESALPPVTLMKTEPESEEAQIFAEIQRRSGFTSNSSTGSDESFGAYVTRKLDEMEQSGQPEVTPKTNGKVKQSESEPIVMQPNCSPDGQASSKQTLPLSLSKYISAVNNPDVNQIEPAEVIDTYEFTFAPAVKHKSIRNENEPCQLDSTSLEPRERHLAETQSGSETEVPFLSDHDSTRYARSTLAEALAPPKTQYLTCNSDGSDYESTIQAPVAASREAPISISSREIIRKCFAETNPISLPQGHPTVAFNQEQMCQMLKVVADETAKSTFGMMNSLILKASQLNLNQSPHSAKSMHRPKSVQSTGTDSETDRYTFRHRTPSGQSDFWTTDHSREQTPSRASEINIPSPPVPGCSRNDLQSPALEKTADSPGAQTLAELKREAAVTKTKKKKGSKRPTATKSKKKKPVWRSNKVMREELFEGISWARTFVTGPMDPKWNPYKFYCQICKGNVSIYGRGVKEILRHHKTERHLRRDQRWRYEHLSVEDPVTKTIRHYVRDENGKLLTPYELELEYPKFKDVTLVDIGEKLPFYDEAMAGNTHMTSSSENRVRVQISILGHFLPNFGDIRSLRSLWKDIGVVVNHQALFSDFNWGKERLSVSPHKVICDSASN